MEIKNILKTGYHVVVVTVALIEAFELGKNLIGRCNKKTAGALETVAGTNSVERPRRSDKPFRGSSNTPEGYKEINGDFWETF